MLWWILPLTKNTVSGVLYCWFMDDIIYIPILVTQLWYVANNNIFWYLRFKTEINWFTIIM